MNQDHMGCLAPSKSGTTLDALSYYHEGIFAWELKHIFADNWQFVGHVDEFREQGDYKLIQLGKVPVIVIKAENNTFRGMHNVCRHRAGPLATKEGNCSVLTCRYHGWSYNLQGQLIHAPLMQENTHFEKEKIQLPQVKLKIWKNLIFVALNPSPPDLDTVLKGIDKAIEPIHIERMKFSHQQRYHIDCNWKVYMDNYLEGYHLPWVHPGLSKVLKFQKYQTEVFPWYSYQWSPMKASQNNQTDEKLYQQGKAHYFAVFPNFMMNILPGRLQTNRVMPLTATTTEVIFDYYYDDLDSPETIATIEQDKNFSDEIQQEDIDICVHVQKGLESGSYHRGIYNQKMEQGVAHFHNLMRDRYQKAGIIEDQGI